MKKVLILGSNGFVGTHLVQHLSPDYSILRMSYTSDNKKSNSLFFKANSAENLSFQLNKIYKSNAFDAVVFTWGAINSSKAVMHEIYINRINEVTAFLKDKEIPLIFFSSGSALRDKSQFALYNVMAEDIIKNSGVKNWIILRPTLIFGQNDNKNLTVIFKYAKILPLLVLPKKSQVLIRPLYIRDLVSIVSSIIEKDLYINETLLISGQDPVDLRTYIEDFLFETRKKPMIISIDLIYIKQIIKKIHEWFTWLPLEQFYNSSSTYNWPHTEKISDFNLSFTHSGIALKEWVRDEF